MDGFATAIFPLQLQVPITDNVQMADIANRMVEILYSLSQIPQEVSNTLLSSGSDDEQEFLDSDVWKTLKSQNGIHIQRMISPASDTDGQILINRAKIPIKCDASRTFQVLSNLAHFKHVYGNMFVKATEESLAVDISVNQCIFAIGKENKVVNLLIHKKRPSSEMESNGEYSVVFRTVSGYVKVPQEKVDLEPNSPPISPITQAMSDSILPTVDVQETSSLRSRRPQSSSIFGSLKREASFRRSEPGVSVETIQDPNFFSEPNSSTQIASKTSTEDVGSFYLFGYRIVPVDSTSCTVLAVSHLSSELQKLDIDYLFCKKMKQFIEELTQLTDSDGTIQSEKKSPGKNIVRFH